jgi:hypothetical protein
VNQEPANEKQDRRLLALPRPPLGIIRHTVPEYSDNTSICSFLSGCKTAMITNSFTLTLLRSFCSSHGGHHRFGFAAHKNGN